MANMTSPGDVRYISGIKVKFPVKPYSSQILMMERIVKGIERGQNCLLESPTGSGKSLALLCSALAWQEAEYEKAEKENRKLAEDSCPTVGPCTCGAAVLANGAPPAVPANVLPPAVQESHYFQPTSAQTVNTGVSNVLQDKPVDRQDRASSDVMTSGDSTPAIQLVQSNTEEEDKDFRPIKRFRTPGGQVGFKRVHKGIVYEDMEEGDVKEGVATATPPPGPPAWTMQITSAVGSSYAAQLTHATPTALPTAPPIATPTATTCAACLYRKNKEADCAGSMANCTGEKRKVPKIYFGTRTHKQIGQIAHELGRTAYREARMCILSSREHTCIHPEVSMGPNKNEGCKEKLDHNQCSYFDNYYKISQSSIKSYGLITAWDIEDFVGVCKKRRACPYFGARQLLSDAQIVFCPYNYLIDPVIRENMEISLQDQIVILDEAHNIEDSAREAASYSLNQEQLRKAIDDLRFMVDQNIKREHHLPLKNMCENIQSFLNDTGSSVEQKDFSGGAKVWSGLDIVARLQHMGIGPDQYMILMQHFIKIQEDDSQMENKRTAMGVDTPKLNAGTLQVFKGLFMVLGFLYKNNLKYLDDYKLALVKTITHKRANVENQWLSKRRARNSYVTEWVYCLNFWCLNPAVAFQDLEETRSVVLTSGTLSPMDSFQSELGIPFPIQLEASHVVGKKQVWVGTVTRGPHGHPLQATYQNTETFTFQDELGQLVLNVCQTIPRGVLVFVSSYNMLEKLKTRWEATGLGSALQEKKVLFCEPRASEKVDFDDLMKSFYKAIEETTNGEAGDQDGALFLAVCRGKVSEGLDFADDNARAVITVGIPFPNVKDLQVELKRNYNNQHHASRGLLTGSQWYEIQAYRALNQALGRCIRHIRDWGALILVDQRFGQNPQKYTKGLSKWVRQRVQNHVTFTQAKLSLQEFTQSMIENPPTMGNPNTSMNSSLAGGFFPSSQSPLTQTSSQEDVNGKQQENSSCIDLTTCETPDRHQNVSDVVEMSASPALKKKTNMQIKQDTMQSIIPKTNPGSGKKAAKMGQTFIGQYVLSSPAPTKGKNMVATVSTPLTAKSNVNVQNITPVTISGKSLTSSNQIILISNNSVSQVQLINGKPVILQGADPKAFPQGSASVRQPVGSQSPSVTAVDVKQCKTSTETPVVIKACGPGDVQPVVSASLKSTLIDPQKNGDIKKMKCKLSLGDENQEKVKDGDNTTADVDNVNPPKMENQEKEQRGKLKDQLNRFRFQKEDNELGTDQSCAVSTPGGGKTNQVKNECQKKRASTDTSKRNRFYQFVNIPDKEEGDTVDIISSPAEKEEESSQRYTCTPPLFDSESQDGFSAGITTQPDDMENQKTPRKIPKMDTTETVNIKSEVIHDTANKPDDSIKKEKELQTLTINADIGEMVSKQGDPSVVNTRSKRVRSLSRKRPVSDMNKNAKVSCHDTSMEGSEIEKNTRDGRKKRNRSDPNNESSKRHKSRDILDMVDQPREQTDDEDYIQCKLCCAELCKKSQGNTTNPKSVPEVVSQLSSGSENVVQVDRGMLGTSVTEWEGGILKGVQVNCVWCEKDQCCLQYLKCAGCKGSMRNKSAIGIQVVTAGQGSKYTTGQTWLLSKLVK